MQKCSKTNLLMLEKWWHFYHTFTYITHVNYYEVHNAAIWSKSYLPHSYDRNVMHFPRQTKTASPACLNCPAYWFPVKHRLGCLSAQRLTYDLDSLSIPWVSMMSITLHHSSIVASPFLNEPVRTDVLCLTIIANRQSLWQLPHNFMIIIIIYYILTADGMSK